MNKFRIIGIKGRPFQEQGISNVSSFINRLNEDHSEFYDLLPRTNAGMGGGE
jgi:hypothetical protein